jgi:hypothetical protein
MPALGQGINAYLSMPNVALVNRTVSAYLVVDDPGHSISVNAMAISGAGISIYPNATRTKFEGFGIMAFSLVPTSPGSSQVMVSFSATAGNSSVSKQITRTVIVENQPMPGSYAVTNATKQPAFGGYITNDYERIDYPTSAQAEAYDVTYWSHCAYHDDWTGNVEPENQQCGLNTWGFDTGDPLCNPYAWNGDDRYYCFARVNEGINVSTLLQNFGYSYSITLHLSNSTLNLSAQLSSAADTANVIGNNGKIYGTAAVEGAYGQNVYPTPYSSYAVIYSGSNARAVNISTYSAYSTTQYDLVQQLTAYNNTGGGNLGYIESLINTLNSQETILGGAPEAASDQCALDGVNGTIEYSCNATTPISFNILVEMNRTLYQKVNQTLYMQDSEVRIV